MILPVIIASQPSTNEPEEIITFNKWWIENLNVHGLYDGKIKGLVILAKFGSKSDGSMVFNGEKITLTIDDMISEAQSNELLASIMGGIIQYVGQKVVERGEASSVDIR